MKGRFLLYSIVLLIACLSCSSEGNKTMAINYYYWKAQGSIDVSASQYLKESNSNKLYLRFFDVHYIDDEFQQGPFPVSVSQVSLHQLPEGVEVIPVVYIENEVFVKSSQTALDALSGHINQEIENLLERNNPGQKLSEIQIDCDWTEGSREEYFAFLKQLKNEKELRLSTTIRLHQVKYFNTTGIPPADYGVLMFYNMGEVSSMQERNSILNLVEAEKYLSGIDAYPLTLVPAYPFFSWGVLFRKKEAIALLNNIDISLFESRLFQKDGEGRYHCLERCFIDGKWLYKDDVVRFETVDPELLEQAVELVSKYVDPQNECILYHLNADLMKRASAEDLKDIFQ